MEAASKVTMAYRYLGNTGLKVSVLSYGTWLTAHDPKSEAAIVDCVKAAWDSGVNFFDTAEIYGAGNAEVILGTALKALKVPRKDLVVSTKLFKCGDGPNDSFMSAKHIREGLNNSLERLQLDYVDVVFSHRPDLETPLEETLRAFDQVIREGKAYYWATSEWSAPRITRAIEMCERLGLHKPIAEQCQYSALVRENMEKSYRPVFEDYKYGTTIWSPLAGGLLSGKYNSREMPDGSRFSEEKNKMFLANFFGQDGEKREDALKILNSLAEVAKELGCSQAQLCLAWTLVNGDVSTCIFGASKVSQVLDNIKAVDIASNWTKDLDERINAILGNEPASEMDFSVWKPRETRRSAALDLSLAKRVIEVSR